MDSLIIVSLNTKVKPPTQDSSEHERTQIVCEGMGEASSLEIDLYHLKFIKTTIF